MRMMRVALLIGALSACSDPCSVVIGCSDSRRVAVEGRVLLGESGRPARDVSVRLLAEYPDRVDSVASASDSYGLFSLRLPSPGPAEPRVLLRVIPRDRPGYLLVLDGCEPVAEWGEACVLNPLITEPDFPLFRFHSRADAAPLTQTRVSFRRTGGARIFRRVRQGVPSVEVESLSVVTDDAGIGMLFPPETWASGMDPVIGDLTVDLPAPAGRVTRSGYQVVPNARYSLRGLAVQLVGPTLAYRFEFADSGSGAPLKDVELRYRRQSGVATLGDTFNVRSLPDGNAYFALVPRAHGSLVGDLSIRATPRPVVTEIKGMTLDTFDQDSTLLFGRWRVGATGILYPQPPGKR